MLAEPSALTGQVKGGRKFYRQLLDMQDVLYTAALNPDTDASQRAACARAWEVLEERKRIMRGRPLPGSLRPEAKRTKRTRDAASPIAPTKDETRA